MDSSKMYDFVDFFFEQMNLYNLFLIIIQILIDKQSNFETKLCGAAYL